MFDVLIVGAGPAGLTAGYELVNNSTMSVCILEEHTSLVGGISRTEERKGYLLDVGSHRFFSKSEEVNAFWKKILPNDFLSCERKSRIYYNKDFYNYPLKIIETLNNLGIMESMCCVLSFIKAQVFPIKNPTTFHEWVVNRFGERLYCIFFKSYTEKVWGISCSELSADWAAQRIKNLSLGSAIGNALLGSLGFRKNGVTSLIDRFIYPRKGPGMFWREVSRLFIKNGGLLLMGQKAVEYVWDETSSIWEIVIINKDGEKRMLRAKHVVSSAPLKEVVAATFPAPLCVLSASKLSYRAFFTVALVLKKKMFFDDHWIYIHDNTVLVGRIQNFAAWSPEMTPTNDKVCLGLEYFCNENDDLWKADDSRLISLAIKELCLLGFACEDDIDEGFVIRQPKAYPVYDENYDSIVKQVRAEYDEKFPAIHFVGRSGMHRYNNQDHAMMTAMLVAKNIIAGEKKYDQWLVNEDAYYHEEG